MNLLLRVLIASAAIVAPLGVTTTATAEPKTAPERVAVAATPTCNTSYVAALPGNQRVGFPTYRAGSRNERNCVVRPGTHAGWVYNIQWALRDCHRINPGPADGKYGPRTKAAVAAFQRAVGIPADGIYGPRTEDFMQWTVWKGNSWTGQCRR
jgi:peptidoglycan hydrolase-like protein with peptidoglycan-binding domain